MAGGVRGLRSADHWVTNSYFLLRNALKLMALYLLVRFLMHLASLFSTSDGWSSTEIVYPAKQLPPILPSSSPIVDDVRSGLVHVLEGHLKNNDTALLLFYAPWCIHSSRAAKTVLAVADRLKGEVPVYAIDCWEPGGSCRWENPSLIYPQVAAVHRHLQGKLIYHGPLSVGALEHFGRRLLRPMVYVTSQAQLEELMMREEVVAVGHFDFSQQTVSPEYLQFYFASLLGLQTDSETGSFRAPIFAVITSQEVGVALSLQTPPSVTLFSLEGRRAYSGSIQHNLLYRWVVTTKPIMEVTQWLVPSGNLSHLLSHPVALLFLPATYKEDATNILMAEYRAAAIAHKRAELVGKSCNDLAHLKHTICLEEHGPHPQSLPLCSHHPFHTCPKYQPFYIWSLTNESYCQDVVGNAGVTAGWPPPCDQVRLQFYLVDSDRYWSLAKSMGLYGNASVSSYPLIVSDLRNKLQFVFDVDLNTTRAYFSNCLDSVLTGSAPLLYRSSSRDNSDSCEQWHPVVPCIRELSATSFNSAVLTSPPSVLVVHYTRWCAACVAVWPKIQSLAYLYRSTPHLFLTKMNGDSNDLPWCHAPAFFPSISLYPASRKWAPVWFPLEWEISSDLLVQFIANHTGIVPEHVGLRPDDHHHLHKNRGVREWEDKGWSLWRIAETEKRVMQRENQQLVRRINQLEQSVKEARNGPDTGTVIESLLSQLEETVSKMMHSEQQRTGRIHIDSHHHMMENEIDKMSGNSMELAEECPAAGSEQCTGNGCQPWHQLDQNTENSPNHMH